MPQSIAFDPLDKLITEYDDLDPGATASSGLPVAYISSDESIAIIVDGKIRGIAGGTVIITAVQEGDDYWEAASPVSHELLVIPRAAQTIAFHPIPELKVDHGDYDPQATATSGLPVIYTSSNTDVARVIDGKIRIFREGTATIVASQPGDSLWYAAPDVAHTLVVVGPDEPEVSSAVSPNGDGENDILFIEGIQNYPQNWLVIMDRNGVEVFRIAGYNNRDKVFDGRSSTNRLLPQGTYFYILETTYKGETKRRKGWFMLKYQ
nr:gliding motility-associated C-terminal domain-containing protein [Parapedobacter composti]